MDTSKYRTENVLMTFAIGLIAGVSPFLFMKLLPVLMNPGLQLTPPNYYAIAITGALIGCITAILFGSTDEKRGAQDIFLYALGIPAILIATVSNLSTEFQAIKDVAAIKGTVSSSILMQPNIEKVTISPVEVPPDSKPQQSGWLVAPAWAQEAGRPEGARTDNVRKYLLVIGGYGSKDDAIAAYRKYGASRLNAEQYISKSLELVQLGTKEYAIVFSRYATREEATKAYQLLRINDPNVPVRIVEK